MSAHLDQLAALAASLPPGAVLAHVVTEMRPFGKFMRGMEPRAWAKIGDEPWRSVRSVDIRRLVEGGLRWAELEIEWLDGWDPIYRIVTDSVVWEQGYGLRGRHEVMGVVGW